ncbi:hypothetical protein Tco_1552820, partial [Tanacetum coccineum]
TLDARDLRRKLRSRRSRSMSGSPERNPSVFSRIRRDRSESPRHRPEGRRDGGVFNILGGKGKSVYAHSKSRYHSYHSRRTNPTPKKCYHKGTSSQDTEAFSESEDSNWWTLEVKISSHPVSAISNSQKRAECQKKVKTYDRCDDPEDHLKNFHVAAKVERWEMPTWCHMFNSTLTGSARVWFDDLPSESIDNYNDLKKAFLVYQGSGRNPPHQAERRGIHKRFRAKI